MLSTALSMSSVSNTLLGKAPIVCLTLADIRQIAGHFWAIFRSVEARCKEIPLVTDCAGSQIAGLARWQHPFGNLR
jgi:hypothetical protein